MYGTYMATCNTKQTENKYMYIQYYTTSTCMVHTWLHAILNKRRTSTCTFNITQQVHLWYIHVHVHVLNDQRTSTCTFNIIQYYKPN